MIEDLTTLTAALNERGLILQSDALDMTTYMVKASKPGVATTHWKTVGVDQMTPAWLKAFYDDAVAKIA